MSMHQWEGDGTIRDRIRQEPVLAALRRPQSLRFCCPEERAQQFRLKAEELRTIAEDVILQETRDMLLRLADNYERIASASLCSV